MLRSRITALAGSRLATACLTKSLGLRLIVLCYHDLRERGDFSSWLRVEADMFRRHLEAIAHVARFVDPTALDDNLSMLESGSLHVLITFDDGYPNNLRLAADLLAEAHAPALFFVSTHHLVSGEPFWFDRVVNRLQAARLDRLDLTGVGLADYRFAAEDGPARWEGIERVLSDLKRRGNDDHPTVARALDVLERACGPTSQPCEQWFRPISIDELRRLAARPGITIGSHGHRHEILTYLADDRLSANLTESRRLLEDLLNREVTDFAFPNGTHDDRVVAASRAAGYRRAYLAAGSAVATIDDPWRIPRVLVGGYDSPRTVLAKMNRALLRAWHGH
jgi:peptidoglycan/xylan/chitin deacetylase (PgdA/CDA1 family)